MICSGVCRRRFMVVLSSFPTSWGSDSHNRWISSGGPGQVEHFAATPQAGHVHGRGVLGRAVGGLEKALAKRRPPCDPYLRKQARKGVATMATTSSYGPRRAPRASTWGKRTLKWCARSSRPSSRPSWVPRSMRSAALATTSPERTHRRERVPQPSFARRGSAPPKRTDPNASLRGAPSPTGSKSAVSFGARPDQLLATCFSCSGSRHAGSSSWLAHPRSRSARRPRSFEMAHSLRRRGPSRSHPSPRRPSPTRSS